MFIRTLGSDSRKIKNILKEHPEAEIWQELRTSGGNGKILSLLHQKY